MFYMCMNCVRLNLEKTGNTAGMDRSKTIHTGRALMDLYALEFLQEAFF